MLVHHARTLRRAGARRTAGLALTANLALAGMRALDMDAHGDREGATGVIRAAMRVWPGLFPDRPDRDALAAWVSDLHGDAVGALRLLNRMGLASDGDMEALR